MDAVIFNGTKKTNYYQNSIQQLRDFVEKIYDQNIQAEEKKNILSDFSNKHLESNSFLLEFLNDFCGRQVNERNVILDFFTKISPISTEDFRYIKDKKLGNLYSIIMESNFFPDEKKRQRFIYSKYFISLSQRFT